MSTDLSSQPTTERPDGARDPELAPGEMAAEYRIEAKIGEGGFGAVYRAIHVVLGRPVAIKVLHHRHSHRTDVVTRFVAEARAVNQIRHRGIIDIFAFGTLPDGRHYFVMELLRGKPFDRLLHEEGALEPDDALPILRDIARALDAAHSKGIAHRDLKPENVFIVTDERGIAYPKLLDFGIAKLCSATGEHTAMTPTGEQLGTPQYMSPEQCLGQLIDHRTDIYSFGVLCHQVLTGRLPFDQYPHLEVLVAHMKMPPPRLSEHCPSLGTGLDAAVLHMLEKSPSARPQSAGQAIQALEKAALYSRRPASGTDATPAGVAPEITPESVATTLVAVPKPGGGAPHRQSFTTEKTTPSASRRPRRAMIVGVVSSALLAIGIALLIALPLRTNANAAARASDAAPMSVAPAPAPTPANTAAPVEISMVFSSGKREWIEGAAASFQREHPEIKLTLKTLGSVASVRSLLSEGIKPTIWSPADSIEMSMAVDEWKTSGGSDLVASSGPDVPESLVVSPLVFVIWEDRANVLLKASRGQITWRGIHDAVTSNHGWTSLGGKQSWGYVKLGHTDPTQSGSGLQALALMALEYSKKPAIDVDDISGRGFLKFLKETERRTKFKPNSGAIMTDLVRFGPSKYDLLIICENLAISQFEYAHGRWGNLRVYYPTPTFWNDHPAAILQTEWVSEPQKQAARTWLAYLRSRPMQERALAFGYRPVDPSVPVRSSDPDNPWTKLAPVGVQVDIPPAASPPDPATLRELIALWSQFSSGT